MPALFLFAWCGYGCFGYDEGCIIDIVVACKNPSLGDCKSENLCYTVVGWCSPMGAPSLFLIGGYESTQNSRSGSRATRK